MREEEVLTPAQAARDWLRKNNCSPHLLVHKNFEREFEDLEPGERTAVLIGDAAEGFSYQRLNSAFRALAHGAELVALAENRAFKDADGLLSLDAGAFVRALEFASQCKATVVGKPSQTFFGSAVSQMSCPQSEVVMVGDDAEADVAGALAAGIGSALLVRTGKYRDKDEIRFQPPPTAVVDDIGAATEWIFVHRM